MDSGMRSISNYDSMPYTIVTSLEMSDESNFFAIHNAPLPNAQRLSVVFDAAKILIFLQFTTVRKVLSFLYRCLLCCKDTNFFAIHNISECVDKVDIVCLDVLLWSFSVVLQKYKSFLIPPNLSSDFHSSCS